MQAELFHIAPARRKQKHAKSTQVRTGAGVKHKARPARRRQRTIIPSTWALPALASRQGWLQRFLSHYEPVLVNDPDAWAAPIPVDGPTFSDDLRAWLDALTASLPASACRTSAP